MLQKRSEDENKKNYIIGAINSILSPVKWTLFVYSSAARYVLFNQVVYYLFDQFYFVFSPIFASGFRLYCKCILLSVVVKYCLKLPNIASHWYRLFCFKWCYSDDAPTKRWNNAFNTNMSNHTQIDGGELHKRCLIY